MGKKNAHALVYRQENLANRKFKTRSTQFIGSAKRVTKEEVLNYHTQPDISLMMMMMMDRVLIQRRRLVQD